jgi:DNA-binding NarL/FixJ family response regulator
VDGRISGFSPRQREVVEHLREGLTNRQIARELGIAESTVKSHVSAAFLRLGVDSRARAAAMLNGRIDARSPATIEIDAMQLGMKLTARQAEILHLVADGLTNRQIGRRLLVSEGTIKAQLTAIFWRLGVANRVQAAARLARTRRASHLPYGAQGSSGIRSSERPT